MADSSYDASSAEHGSRILATGLSAAALLGIVAVLGAQPPN
jgi:hypothetical protein